MYSDLTAILELAKNYYDGMFYGRTQTLEHAFEPGARFQGVRDGEQVRRELPEFLSMVAAPASEAAAPLDYWANVELVDLTGPLAVIKVKDRFRGRTYVDYLTAIKTGTGWRIVNKAFTTID